MEIVDTTKEINKFIKSYKKSNDIDFLRYIGVENDKKCSVLSQYYPESRVITYCRENSFKSMDGNDYYYGLNPRFTERKIIIDVINSEIDNYLDLKKY